jgi:hypothetical protein
MLDNELSQLRSAVIVGNLGTAADQAARLAALIRNISLP